MYSIPTFQESAVETIGTITKIDCKKIAFFSTPYFRKYYNRIMVAMNDSTVQDYDKTKTFFQFFNYVNNISKFYQIWDSIPNDHFQNNREFLESAAILKEVDCKTIASWMRENISYESFFNMIRSYLTKNKVGEFCTLLNDTMNQLSKLLSGKKTKNTVTRPNRWRLNEFHDHISYQFLKSTTKNREHDNTLIPNPVDIDDWVIQQPKDTIELKVWGQQVRNCVASYEDSILNDKLKIILLLQNSKPKYTVEIEPNVKRGIIIKQMVEQCNRQATPDERKLAETLIARAIAHHNPTFIQK